MDLLFTFVLILFNYLHYPMSRLFIICIILLFAPIKQLSADAPILIEQLEQNVYVRDMDQYVDSSSSLTYLDFQTNRNRFYKPDYDLQGTRNRFFTYWMTFRLQGELLRQEDFVFYCTDSRISHMEMWIDGQPMTENPIGTDYLFHNRSVNSRYLAYYLPHKEEMEVVIKIKSNQASFFAFEVKEKNAFLGEATWETSLLGGAYGVFFLSALFSLLMRLKFPDAVYWTYACFIGVAILTCLYLDGLGFQYYWSDFPQMNLFLLLFLPVAIIFTCTLMVITFVEAWSWQHRYLRIMILSMISIPLGYISTFLVPQYFLHNFFYIVPFMAMFYVCISCYRKGFDSMLPFLAGFVLVIITNSLYILQPFISVEYYNFLIRLSPHFSVVGLVIALSYAQYVRFYSIFKSRSNAKRKAFLHLEQLNAIKDRINEEIVHKVAEQTEELERKNAIIHQQNVELQFANDRLKEQTDQIVNLNLKLSQENQELKSDVKRIRESRILQDTIPFDDFKEYFKDDETCYALLEELKWQQGFACSKCGNSKYGKGKGPLARRCTKCGTNESVTSNTIFHRLHFPISKGFYMLFLVNKFGDNVTSKDLSELLDLRLATCWKFGKKIKTRMQELTQSGKSIESWMDLI